ncbi:cytochrome c [Sulfurovum sp.]|uniref:c-type cytochrome n=1 Tax=Sulfurovum sp. TaxID=1969726 RepID=UPI0025FD3E2F|nr:cytochrome c [Sulfurovum sp.]
MNKSIIVFFSLLIFTSNMQAESGKKVFETYCWGCHHQTAVAFGPPFSQIASKRTAEEIQGMIADPEGVSKVFGYKRNAMPAFKLNPEELKAITAYILSFKPTDTKETNSSQEHNKTIVKDPYPNMAANKENK